MGIVGLSFVDNLLDHPEKLIVALTGNLETKTLKKNFKVISIDFSEQERYRYI